MVDLAPNSQGVSFVQCTSNASPKMPCRLLEASRGFGKTDEVKRILLEKLLLEDMVKNARHDMLDEEISLAALVSSGIKWKWL